MIRSMLILACLLAANAGAQLSDPRVPIALDADSADNFGDESGMTFRGLRLTQGELSIEADEGRASIATESKADGTWQLSGNVSIAVANGRVRCDTADLEISGNQVRMAHITGSPARYELRRDGNGEDTLAEAEVLHYDLTTGVIEFSGNANISEGGNQITSDYLVYNIAEQRIQAQGGDEPDERVKIIFTPAGGGESDDNEGDDGNAAPEPATTEADPE